MYAYGGGDAAGAIETKSPFRPNGPTDEPAGISIPSHAALRTPFSPFLLRMKEWKGEREGLTLNQAF